MRRCTRCRLTSATSTENNADNLFEAQMHPLSPDECDVYSGLVQRSKSGKVTVMHNHCMSEQGMVEGFRFSIHAKEISSIMPISRKMFFRHSMVECTSLSSSSQNQEDNTILSLLFKQNEVVFCMYERPASQHRRVSIFGTGQESPSQDHAAHPPGKRGQGGRL